jgi:CubicO group peptidase (beta-lactamase class C family)
MTPIRPSRRDVLKGATAAAALVSSPRVARAQTTTQQAKTRIDPVLKQAVDARDVPGVVAMAATDKGVLYECALGPRALDASAGMTPDTVFRIASMTKAIASVAAMQLVEQGKLKLEEPVPGIDPALASPQVLEGFDASGAPKLRPAKRRITLRHLLTHTAGFTYDIWSPETIRYVKAAGTPHRSTGKVASLRTPLVFDPGDRWLYGIHIEWVGRLIESVSGQTLEDYFRDRIFGPLGMKDTGYVMNEEQRARQARLHTRGADGALAVQPLEAVPVKGEFWSAGGPLYSTARDYLVFLQMLLHGGSFNGVRVLKPETVALMNRNHTGNIQTGVLKAELKNLSNDVDFFPGSDLRWGLGYMLNVQAGPNGRSAGTVSWGGIYNTYYWLDPAKRVTGVIMTQILPFADARALKVYGQLERGVYDSLKAV